MRISDWSSDVCSSDLEKLSRQSASCIARRHHKRRWITVGLRQPLYRRHYGPSGTAAGDEADRNAGAAATIARILDRHGDERLARGVEIGFERGERGEIGRAHV